MSTSLRFLIAALLLLTAGMAPAGADEPTVMCDGKPATMIGTPGDDKLIGDASDDVIVGLGGNDTLVGAGGNDTICGFDGDDTLIGGPGDDILLGGRGSDWLDYRTATKRNLIIDLAAGSASGHGIDTLASIENVEGNDHHNEIYGNGAANILRSDGGQDVVWGRGGDDIIEAGREFTELRGGPGNDHLSAKSYDGFWGPPVMRGGAGNDTIESRGNRVVMGGPGNDNITIFMGDNLVHPGAGDDVIDDPSGGAIVSYWNAPGPIEIDLATGIASGWGTDRLVGVAGVRGTRFDDIMRGGPRRARFYGLGGDDVLEAFDFADPNNVSLVGGRGNDILRGSAGDDSLSGGPGTDLLLGFAGDDDLRGGERRDELDGGTGRDSISFGDSPGPMVINLTTSRAFGPSADSFANIEDVYGSRGDDQITGTDGPNFLLGSAGDDIIHGRKGDDTIRGWPGNDIIYAGFGADYVDGEAGNDVIYGGAGDNMLRGGPGDDLVFGGQQDDTLNGVSGDDTLDGGPHYDTCKEGTTYLSCELIL